MNRGLAGEPRADARLRLFCFHHAGGGAAAFAGWRDAFGPEVDVLPVRLPGRELRMRESRITAPNQLMEELNGLLGPLLDRPFLFYGHSLGGLVAHAFTKHLAKHLTGSRTGTGPLPRALLIGASPAPHQDSALTAAARRGGDGALLRALRDHGGVGEELLNHPKWLDLMLAVVRDDLALAGALRATAGAPLPVPIHVFAGRRDRLAAPAGLRGWAGYTSAGFRLTAVPGGHFFHRDREFRQLLAPVVRGALPAEPADRAPLFMLRKETGKWTSAFSGHAG